MTVTVFSNNSQYPYSSLQFAKHFTWNASFDPQGDPGRKGVSIIPILQRFHEGSFHLLKESNLRPGRNLRKSEFNTLILQSKLWPKGEKKGLINVIVSRRGPEPSSPTLCGLFPFPSYHIAIPFPPLWPKVSIACQEQLS